MNKNNLPPLNYTHVTITIDDGATIQILDIPMARDVQLNSEWTAPELTDIYSFSGQPKLSSILMSLKPLQNDFDGKYFTIVSEKSDEKL